MAGEPTCSIAGCNSSLHARGWCVNHYNQWRNRQHDPLIGSRPKGPPRIPLHDRFWQYAKADGSGCWIWHGGCGRAGYGLVRADQTVGEQGTRPAHRMAYELVKGPIPEGLQIDHLCRNPPCVNPDHLEVVTPRENTLRGEGPAAVNARKTHCIRGHPFDGANTYIQPTSGARRCRACRRAWRPQHAKR